ncbi:hypothetical protein ACH4LK_11135 [Streptomyces lydicus]|uniref:hypothetical protein n=1 Tax=Streptomyces lydicus TaxID=47763 RepID=UPI0037BD2FA0
MESRVGEGDGARADHCDPAGHLTEPPPRRASTVPEPGHLAEPHRAGTGHLTGTDHLTGTGHGIHEAPGTPSRAAAV